MGLRVLLTGSRGGRLGGSGVAVASQLEKLPTPDQIAVIPPGAEGMNVYPVVETADVWLAPQAAR